VPNALQVWVTFSVPGAEHVASAPADGQYRQTFGDRLPAWGELRPMNSRAVEVETGDQVTGGWTFVGRLTREVPVGARADWTWQGRPRQGVVADCNFLGPSRAAVVTITETF
jgi:hypothetical protein